MSDTESIFLINRTRPEENPMRAKRCVSFLCRLRGLTFRKTLPLNWGLLLVQKNENRLDAAIHMLWMRMDLAIVWIDSSGTVVDVQPAFRWRSFLTPRSAAKFVLETSIDYLDRFKIGDEVYFEEIRNS